MVKKTKSTKTKYFEKINVKLMLILLISNLCLASNSGIVSVVDYGAKGDGETDDTAAIKKAMQAAAIRSSKSPDGGSHYLTGPVLLFPAGEYLISDEIDIVCLEIRGVGGAVIRQLNPEKNIFSSKHAWKLYISNLCFVNGKNHLHLYQPNVDSGEIFIEHCRFYKADGVAVYTDVLSTTVKIEDCQFLGCYQSWVNIRTDQAVMRDCWITNSFEMKDKAVIEHSGQRMTIENLAGVSLVTPGNNQRWIDNNGADLTVRECRFGGEGGGFTPVYNLRKYIPTSSKAFDASMGVNIIIDDSFVCGGNDKNTSCAVYCREIPNSIVVQNSVLVHGPAIKIAENIDPETYFVNVSKQRLFFKSMNNTALPFHKTGYADINDPDYANKIPASLANPKIIYGPRPSVSAKEVHLKMKEIADSLVIEDSNVPTCNSHKQKTSPCNFIDITASVFKNPNESTEMTDYRGLLKTEKGLVAFMRTDSVEAKELVFKAKVDLDAYPWLTWRQLKSNTSGSFTVQVKDCQTGELYKISPFAIYDDVYEYRAENLKKLIKLPGVRELEVSWWLYGWDRNPKKDEHWDSVWAWPGQYTVMEFVRFEKP